MLTTMVHHLEEYSIPKQITAHSPKGRQSVTRTKNRWTSEKHIYLVHERMVLIDRLCVFETNLFDLLKIYRTAILKDEHALPSERVQTQKI